MDNNAQANTAEMHNYKSATSQYHEQVENQIREEIREVRYVVTSTKPTIVSGIGAIQKSDDIHVRLIHDASKPEGQGLNDYVSTKMNIKFQSINSVTQLMTPGCYMAKLDLKSAYCSVATHPSQHQRTG